MRSDANSRQVGGGHYKTEYEHWDLAVATGMGHLEGSATKYIARWRKKDGLSDLAKAKHYVEKLIEVANELGSRDILVPRTRQRDEVDAFTLVNCLNDIEYNLVLMLTCWRVGSDLDGAVELLDELITEHTPKPVPLEDSNKHAERE